MLKWVRPKLINFFYLRFKQVGVQRIPFIAVVFFLSEFFPPAHDSEYLHFLINVLENFETVLRTF